HTIAYIGELSSGASQVSLPILNQAGIAQVSPTNTYPGLTTVVPGGSPGEPDKYYPTGRRSYVRVIPTDLVTADALGELMAQAGCHQVSLVRAHAPFGYGAVLAHRVSTRVRSLGLTDGVVELPKDPVRRRQILRSLHAGCVAFLGVDAGVAVQTVSEIAADQPHARLFGPGALANRTFTDPR